MYNITNSDIQEAILQVNSAMTIKGQIIGYSIAFCGKNIENRSRKIRDGWYALHVGGSKNTIQKHSIIYSLIDKYSNHCYGKIRELESNYSLSIKHIGN